MYRFGRRFMIPAPEAVNLLEVFSPKRLTWSGFYDRLILPLKRVYFLCSFLNVSLPKREANNSVNQEVPK